MVKSERKALEDKARGRHTSKYWKRYDKENYDCPDCGNGINDVYRFEVHHKDENPLNGDWDNLIGLCRKCHHKAHGKQPPQTLEEWKEGFLALGTAD